MVDAEGRGDGADLPVLAVIEAANLGVLLGRDHGARLRGHATDPPGRWKEPGAFPATDHATQRARQGRGRHQIRRRVRRQCGERGGALGSLIPHARAIGALVIAMIEAAFGTAAMTLARGADRRARGRATRRRAIRVAAITRDADREETIAASTDFLAKRRVHDVGAAARFDWTRRANRGTRETTGSVRRSIEAVTEGGVHRLRSAKPATTGGGVHRLGADRRAPVERRGRAPASLSRADRRGARPRPQRDGDLAGPGRRPRLHRAVRQRPALRRDAARPRRPRRAS